MYLVPLQYWGQLIRFFYVFFFFFLDVNGVLRWDRNLFLGSRSHQFSYFPPEAMLTLGAGVDTPRFSPAVTVSGFQAVESQRQLYLSPLHFLMLYSLMNSSCKSSTWWQNSSKTVHLQQERTIFSVITERPQAPPTAWDLKGCIHHLKLSLHWSFYKDNCSNTYWERALWYITTISQTSDLNSVEAPFFTPCCANCCICWQLLRAVAWAQLLNRPL